MKSVESAALEGVSFGVRGRVRVEDLDGVECLGRPLCLDGGGAENLVRRLDARQARVQELGVLRQMGRQRPVEDPLRGALADRAVDPLDEVVERLVDDAAVGVHAAAVGVGVDELRHRGRLALGSRVRHVPEGVGHLRAHDPVVRPIGVQLHHLAEDVRHGLVQGARLVLIDEIRRAVGDAVRQLVADDVDRAGIVVGVAEAHRVLRAVPERVLEVDPDPHEAVDGPAIAVERVSVWVSR